MVMNNFIIELVGWIGSFIFMLDYYLLLYNVSVVIPPLGAVLIHLYCSDSKKNNLLLFYNFTLFLYSVLELWTSFNFIDLGGEHGIEEATVVFTIFTILDLIVTAVYFKDNKKKYITYLIIFVLLLCVVFFIKFQSLTAIRNITSYGVIMLPIILFAVKTVSLSLLTLYLFCRIFV
jgi:hypothetical protein